MGPYPMSGALSMQAPTVRRQRWLLGLGVLAGLLLAGTAVGVQWVRRSTSTRTVNGQLVLPTVARMRGLADMPVYPAATPDPDTLPLARGSVQSAIYLTDDSPDQVKTYYRDKLALNDGLIRELPSTWVADLATPTGERFTIQAEPQMDGSGTRLSLVYMGIGTP